MTDNSNKYCNICTKNIEGDYILHLISTHLYTFICMIATSMPYLSDDDIFYCINNYVDDYISDNNYEHLTELCNNIGYYKKSISDINSICKHVEITNMEDKCPICLEQLNNKDTIYKVIKCNHIFCSICITEWLKNNSFCPMCKNDLI